jgi:hypothetical protein
MQRFLFLTLSFFMLACEMQKSDKNPLNHSKPENVALSQEFLGKDSTIIKTSKENTQEVLLSEETAAYFIVVADTGKNYYVLNQKMYELRDRLHMQVDTMDRYYNKKKDLISLPISHEDKMYAGDYFPRRFPSEYLSLEYLNFYREQASKKTIALVTGIYETSSSADSALSVLQNVEKNSFVFKTNIYVGCAH